MISFLEDASDLLMLKS